MSVASGRLTNLASDIKVLIKKFDKLKLLKIYNHYVTFVFYYFFGRYKTYYTLKSRYLEYSMLDVFYSSDPAVK